MDNTTDTNRLGEDARQDENEGEKKGAETQTSQIFYSPLRHLRKPEPAPPPPRHYRYMFVLFLTPGDHKIAASGLSSGDIPCLLPCRFE